MCGIFGIIFHKPSKLKQLPAKQIGLLMDTLALANAVRGTDSTGVARVLRTGEVVSYKKPLSSFRMVRQKAWTKIVTGVDDDTCMILGHTRAATHGDKTEENAHPFTFVTETGVLVGTHNGVIQNYKELKPEETFENDSRNLFWRLAHTPDAELPDVLKIVKGGFALAFAKNGVPHLTRISSNPMYVAYMPQLGATIYSSIKDSLVIAEATADLDMGKIRELPVGKLFQFLPGRKTPLSVKYAEEPPPSSKSTSQYSGYSYHSSGWDPYNYSGRVRGRPVGFQASPASTTSSVTNSSVGKQTTGEPRQTRSKVRNIPGLVEGEELNEFINVKTSIVCHDCKNGVDETVLRVINDNTICSECWSERVARAASPNKVCHHCKGPDARIIHRLNDKPTYFCSSCWDEGAYLLEVDDTAFEKTEEFTIPGVEAASGVVTG